MFNRILIPLDGSPLAERAIPHAELFARIFGASVVLLQVLEPASYYENPQAVDPISWQIRKVESDIYLQGIAERIRRNLAESSMNVQVDEKSRVEYAIREGKTAENIVDFAHAEAIDLLVISTHGSGGLSRWSLSSTIQKVINLIYLPVLIVRSYNQNSPDESLRAYRRILLPIDSSRRAECAFSAGIELTRGEMPAVKTTDSPSEASKLVLAAVIRPPEIPVPEPYPLEINLLLEQLMQVSRLAVNKYLNDMRERLPVDCETCVVENSSVSSAIHELADQEEIDLVILCAHGYSGRVTWPYGTVTRNYMEHGSKPILVIQDVARSQVRLSAAASAAEKSGRR